MRIDPFFDPATETASYVVSDPATGAAAIIDPVLDFDPNAGRTGTTAADRVRDFVRTERLRVQWLLETHVHADHLSAAGYLREQLGGKTAIGEHVREVQATFARLFDVEPPFRADGSQFDKLFRGDEMFGIGELAARALHVPGHTPADIAYLVGDALFVGDTLFMPDVGTARADFPGGDARTLYRSIRRLLALPPATRIFVCHDYPPAGRDVRCETSVSEERTANIHVRDGIDEDAFVEMRTTRDRTLAMPRLILPSVQVNIRAGAFPPPATNGLRYLKIPIDAI